MSDDVEGRIFIDRGATALAHYGKKGMRWGVTNAKSSSSSGSKESRKEYKSNIKKEQDAFYQKKIDNVVTASLKRGDEVLIATKLPGDMAVTVATGKQFVDHIKTGAAFDIKTTDIFITFDERGPQREYLIYRSSRTRLCSYRE